MRKDNCKLTDAQLLERCYAVTCADFVECAPRTKAVNKDQAADLEAFDERDASTLFDSLAGVNAVHMSVSVPQKALAALDRLNKIKNFVDQYVAHTGPKARRSNHPR
jgi:hypothetical protein